MILPLGLFKGVLVQKDLLEAYFDGESSDVQ